MKKTGLLFAVLATAPLALTACSGFSNRTAIDSLNEAKPVGSAFTQALAAGYKKFSNSQQNRYFDYADALHFAKKGLLAAEGKNVLPEPLANWQVGVDAGQELGQARTDLMAVLDHGGRAQKPDEAARAQLKFDCWIEQQEENLILTPSCKAEFMTAMNELAALLKDNRPASQKAGQPVPPRKPLLPPIDNRYADPNGKGRAVAPLAPVVRDVNGDKTARTMDEGMFLVFYDFDRSKLNESGQAVMQAVAKQLKARKDIRTVTVTGFTDTSGSTAYNRKLSMKRADSVRAALVKLGVDEKLLTVKAMGETQLMVKTPDNTREPANRRAEIHFD